MEESDRKNIFFEAKNADVVAFLQRVEDTLAEEGGVVNSCLAKEGMLRCKLSLKQVHVFDKDRRATSTPPKFAGWTCNVLGKLIGKLQTPDGGASGLKLTEQSQQIAAKRVLRARENNRAKYREMRELLRRSDPELFAARKDLTQTPKERNGDLMSWADASTRAPGR